jgi:hypothetical protein
MTITMTITITRGKEGLNTTGHHQQHGDRESSGVGGGSVVGGGGVGVGVGVGGGDAL